MKRNGEERLSAVDVFAKALRIEAPDELTRLERHFDESADLVEAWFREQPQWLEELSKDPQSAIDRLLKYTRWDGPQLQLKPPKDLQVVVPRPRSEADNLFDAIWPWAQSSPANYEALSADPMAATRSVAALIGASNAAVNDVLLAYAAVLRIGRSHVPAIRWSGDLPDRALIPIGRQFP